MCTSHTLRGGPAKGWEIPVTNKKMRFGVPVKKGVTEFDAAVGDIIITANRSMYVDFTTPFTGGGLNMIVPIRHKDGDDKWAFLKPLKRELWLKSIAFFILTGAVLWILEQRTSTAFRGPLSQHVGMLFYFPFPFSTMVFAHKEQSVSNLARLVVVVWVFVVLVLTSIYTASLSSWLTAERLKPTIDDVHQFLKSKQNVRYETGSFVAHHLREVGFEESYLKPYICDEECIDALDKGSRNGGISAFFSAETQTKVFFSKYCDKYMVVGPLYRTNGFEFVLPKESPLVADVSRAVINLTEGPQILLQLEKLWFSYEPQCTNPEGGTSSDRLKLDSFSGLLAIIGSVTGICLIIYIAITRAGGEGGRDINRLEYFSVKFFVPHHAREIPDFDDEGGCCGGGGFSRAARDQLPKMDANSGRQRWWKKVWRLLKPTAQHS